MTAAAIEDVCELIPRSKYGYAPGQAGSRVEPFEYGEVGIRSGVVAVDARIRMPADHLVVAWIGELEPVGDIRVALHRAIPEDLTLLRDDVPYEWKERGACGARIVARELAAERGRILDVAELAIHELAVRALEDLLPAETVGYDEDDVARAMGRLSECAGRRRKRKQRRERNCSADRLVSHGTIK